MKKFLSLKNVIFAPDRIFIFYASLAIFFISLEYSVMRAASVSIFILNYGASYFPYVWIATVPLNFLIVYLYNNFLPRLGCVKIWLIILCITISMNIFSSFFINKFTFLSFFQFMWKDIYILLFYKKIWALINTSFSSKKAKYGYGIIFSVGSIGGLLGGVIAGFFARKIGSSNLFLIILPVYVLLFFIYKKAYFFSNFDEKKENFDLSSKGYFLKVKNSKYLLSILFLVLFMQISVAFTEYKLNLFLEESFLNVDFRTEYIGKLLSIVNFSIIFIQIIAGTILIYFLGLEKAHLMIPVTLCINSIIFLIKPTLNIASYLFVCIKSLDFSLFNMIKEMLYIPLKTDDKFRAKAVIDVFSYRTAKAFASVMLIFINFCNLSYLFSYFLFFIFIMWFLLVKIIFKQYDSKKEVILEN